MNTDKKQSPDDLSGWTLNPKDLIARQVNTTEEIQILTVTAETKGEGKVLNFTRPMTESSRKPFHEFAADYAQFEDYAYLASIAGVSGAKVFLDPHSLMVFIDPKMSWQALFLEELPRVAANPADAVLLWTAFESITVGFTGPDGVVVDSIKLDQDWSDENEQ